MAEPLASMLDRLFQRRYGVLQEKVLRQRHALRRLQDKRGVIDKAPDLIEYGGTEWVPKAKLDAAHADLERFDSNWGEWYAIKQKALRFEAMEQALRRSSAENVYLDPLVRLFAIIDEHQALTARYVGEVLDG